MTETSMLQAIFDTVSGICGDVKNLKNEMNDKFKQVDIRFDEVNKRIDNLGKQLAVLDDDAPTGEEFKNLEKRVTKVENKLASLN